MRYFGYENVNLEDWAFSERRSIPVLYSSRREAAQNLSFILEVRIKIQIHVSIYFTLGIDLYVWFFLRNPSVSLNFSFFSQCKWSILHFLGFTTGWAKSGHWMGSLDDWWAFAHPVNMLEEALPCVV